MFTMLMFSLYLNTGVTTKLAKCCVPVWSIHLIVISTIMNLICYGLRSNYSFVIMYIVFICAFCGWFYEFIGNLDWNTWWLQRKLLLKNMTSSSLDALFKNQTGLATWSSATVMTEIKNSNNCKGLVKK